jgi:hypothetical protein
MQVGDLVRLKGEWARKNPWMRGTLIDDTPSMLGIIIGKRAGMGRIIWQIEWLDGRSSEVLGNRLEVV